jgi:hypothetical protein
MPLLAGINQREQEISHFFSPSFVEHRNDGSHFVGRQPLFIRCDALRCQENVQGQPNMDLALCANCLFIMVCSIFVEKIYFNIPTLGLASTANRQFSVPSLAHGTFSPTLDISKLMTKWSVEKLIYNI